jgi:transcriptional regulator with XRE-family HTH domain
MSTRSTQPEPFVDDAEARLRIAIGARVREGRQRLGLSGRQLATRVGVTSAFISQIERGLGTPSLGTLVRIVDVTGISVGDLFDIGRQPRGEILEREHWRRYQYDATHGVVLANDPDSLQAVWTCFPPRTSIPNLIVPAATTTFVFALRGEVEYREGDTVRSLKEYSSVVLDGTRSRTWSNPHDEPAEVIVVATETG